MGAAWWTQSNISDIYLQIILLYITEKRTIERFCSVPHWFKCHWQTWEQADFLTPCKFGCLLQIEMCFSSCSVTGCTDPLLLLRPCTVWRSWASRWRRWILTEEPSLWVTLWAAPELDRWWRCSTSSDAEGRGSSRLPRTHSWFVGDNVTHCSSLVSSWLQGVRRRVHVHWHRDGSRCCVWIPRTVAAEP